MKISINGYKRDSLDNKESSLMINSNTLTMKGVDRPITAIPIIDGKPDYSQKVVLNPGDPDYTNPNASGFMEIPAYPTGGMFNRMYDNYQYAPLTDESQMFSQINPRFNANQLGSLPTLGGNVTPKTVNSYNGNTYTQDQFGQWKDQSGNYVTQSNVIGTNEQGEFTQAQSFQNDYKKPTPPPIDWSFLNNLNRKRGLQDSLVSAGQSFGFNTDNINASPQAKKVAKGANLIRGISSMGNALLEGTASFMQGMGQANLDKEALEKYQEDMRKALTKQRTTQIHKEGGTFYMQKGGQVKDEMLLTEGYTSGIPQGSPQVPNAELERNEFTIDPETGQTMQVLGKKHSEGGEEMALKNGTKVVSDFIKIGSELARTLKKDYGLSVTPKTTFAKATEKYRNSIGLTKKLNEQTSIIGKIKEQEEVENQNVRDLNLGHLTEKYHNLEQEKAPLDEKMSMFTEMMFDLQEQNKAEEDRKQVDAKLKKGGIIKTFQEGGQLNDNQVTTLINTFCDVTGEDPIEVENMYNQLSDEEKVEAQQSMLSVVQQTEEVPQGGEEQMMQYGGKVDYSLKGNVKALGEGLVNLFTKDPSKEGLSENVLEMFDPTGVTSWNDVYYAWKKDPNSVEAWLETAGALPVIGKLGKIAKGVNFTANAGKGLVNFSKIINNSLDLASKGLINKTKGTGKAIGLMIDPTSRAVMSKAVGGKDIIENIKDRNKTYQEGGETQQDPTMQIIQGFAEMNGVSPDEIVAQLQQMDEQGQQEALQQMVQSLQGQGQGQNAQQGNIETLIQDFASINSVPVEQVVQEFQALDPQGQEQAILMMQEAVSQEASAVKQEVMQEGGTFKTSSDFLNFLDSYKNDPNYKYGDLNSQKERILQWAKEIGVDASNVKLDTQQEMDSFAGSLQKKTIEEHPELVSHYTSNKPFTKADIDEAVSSGLVNKKWFTDRGVKFGKNGKALRGTIESGMKLEDALKVSSDFGEILNKEGNEEKKSNFVSKFNDNKWFYRYPELKSVDFKSQEEADAFTKDYSDVGNGVFYSNKTGLYFKPVITTDDKPTESPKDESETTFNLLERTTKPTNNYGFSGLFDQSMDPPSGLFFGSMQRVESPNLRSVNVSYAPQVIEANRQATTAFDSASMMPDSQRRAVEANIVGQTQMANNQAIAQTQAQNEAINSQIERYNDVAIGETDKLNTQTASNYEDRFLRAKAAEEAQILGWQDFNRKVEAQNLRNEETRNLYNTFADNFQLTGDNRIILDPNNKVQVSNLLKSLGLTDKKEEEDKKSKKQEGGYVRTYLENLYKKKQ